MSVEEPVIRLGSSQDLTAVENVMQQAFDPRFGEAWTKAQCASMMTLPGVWLTLAWLEEDLAGFALTRRVLEQGELLLLAVQPRCRRQGIGRILLDKVAAEAGRHGVETLHLEVRAGNAAIRLYVRAGFEKHGERRGYFRGKDGETFDAFSFVRKLCSNSGL